jgi:hypothetical protein
MGAKVIIHTKMGNGKIIKLKLTIAELPKELTVGCKFEFGFTFQSKDSNPSFQKKLKLAAIVNEIKAGNVYCELDEESKISYENMLKEYEREKEKRKEGISLSIIKGGKEKE